MGQLTKRVDVSHFLDVKDRIKANLDEMRRLNDECVQLYKSLEKKDHVLDVMRGNMRFSYRDALYTIFGSLSHIVISSHPDRLKMTADDIHDSNMMIIDHGAWKDLFDHMEAWKILGEGKQRKFQALSSTPHNVPEFTLDNVQSTLDSIGANRGQYLYERILEVFDRQLDSGKRSNKAHRIGERVILTSGTAGELDRINLLVLNILGLPVPRNGDRIHNRIGSAAFLKKSLEVENDVLRAKLFKNGNIHVWFHGEGLKALGIMNDTLAAMHERSIGRSV